MALAQDTVPIEIRVHAKVVPNKAGTAKHPQAVRIESHGRRLHLSEDHRGERRPDQGLLLHGADQPSRLQIVAGIPIVLRELHIRAGDPRKDWIATTSCPGDRRWRYHVLITFTTGQTKTRDGSVRCR